jgi:hypothetical protein
MRTIWLFRLRLNPRALFYPQMNADEIVTSPSYPHAAGFAWGKRMKKLQLTRIQYGFALGILVATWIHFPSPRALFVFAIASMLTALRFNALGWKPSLAFIPFAIAVVGTGLAMLLGAHNDASKSVAHLWRSAAAFAQLGMTIRAGFANSRIDLTSPRQALAHNFLSQRRRTKRVIDEFKPQMEAHQRAAERLKALTKQLADHIAAHGDKPSAERTLLTEQLAEQNLLVQACTEDLKAGTAKLQAESEALRSATQAWKNRNNSKAA